MLWIAVFDSLPNQNLDGIGDIAGDIFQLLGMLRT
jgi:hypothetical protein